MREGIALVADFSALISRNNELHIAVGKKEQK
jgi:hypothetical protein